MPEVRIIAHPIPPCPICGAMMKLRRPRANQGWEPFFGCSQYPGCKGSRNIDPETGQAQGDDLEHFYDEWEEG